MSFVKEEGLHPPLDPNSLIRWNDPSRLFHRQIFRPDRRRDFISSSSLVAHNTPEQVLEPQSPTSPVGMTTLQAEVEIFSESDPSPPST